MRRDREVTGDRRSWWFWLAIVVVLAAVVALSAWTLVETSGLGVGAEPIDMIAATAIP